jgi:hypothetical protein
LLRHEECSRGVKERKGQDDDDDDAAGEDRERNHLLGESVAVWALETVPNNSTPEAGTVSKTQTQTRRQNGWKLKQVDRYSVDDVFQSTLEALHSASF